MEKKKENQEPRIISSQSAKRTRGITIAVVVILAVMVVVIVVLALPRKSEAQKLEEALSLGEKYLSELEYEQAIASYRTAIEIDPKCTDAYIGLANTYIAMGKPEEALEVLEEAEMAVGADTSEEDLERIREKKKEAKHHIAYEEVGTLEHIWVEATCTENKYCSVCGETEGEPLGHTWVEATCLEARHCNICGKTEGGVLEHTWVEATCAEAKHCSICGTTEGEMLEHTWVEATCTEAKHCSVCGTTEGEALGHTMKEANYQQPATCQVCGETVGEPLQGQFDKYGLTCDTKLDTVYLHEGLPCFDNKNYTTTAKVTLSDYKVFESDETHEALEGYEWRAITIKIVFDDENANAYGYSINADIYFTDYYDDDFHYNEDTNTYTVNYNGVEYSEVKIEQTDLSGGDWVGRVLTLQKYMYLRLPKGCDSIVMIIPNSPEHFNELEDIAELVKERDDTILFRWK